MSGTEDLSDHTADVIFVVDERGRFSYINSAVEEVLGYPPSKLEGTNGFELIHPEDREKAWDEFGKVLEDPEYVGRIEFRVKHNDGSEVVLELRARNRLDDPTINGVVVVGRDITKRKTYERELERQNERLEEFASVVSHDLRNPLNIAQGRLELANEECDSEHLDAVANAHDRMNALIDDLLMLAREGDRVREMEPIAIADVSERCWQNVETADATIHAHIDRTIQADQSRLAQLLENLIRNAVEHGDEDLSVTIGELDDGFYVADDGLGIPEDDRDTVFDAGYSTADKGTGFGLSIVKQVADAHGWDIRVTDSEDGGARFEITGVEFAE